MTIAGGTIDDLSAKLLEVEVRFRRPWILDRQFYLCTITLTILGTSVFPIEHISNPSQVPIVSDEICQKPRRDFIFSPDPKVTYLYISGIITIPKQSECNVNSYNKDTVAFCKCENAVS